MGMARKRRGEVRRLPIELDLADPTQRRVWEYWTALSERGGASAWARDALARSIPAAPGVQAVNLPPDEPEVVLPKPETPDSTPVRPVVKSSSMARPKNPDLQPPPTYGRKAAGVKPIPPFVGRKSGQSED